MNFVWKYQTPEGLDDIILSSNGFELNGLWFEGSQDDRKHNGEIYAKKLPIFEETTKWLDEYFGGKQPECNPKVNLGKMTPFRKEVFEIMKDIPYGQTMTYGEIAKIIAKKRGKNKMSSQAVGGAVGWNPICIIFPCHRVVGNKGKLVGFGGGIKNKEMLLNLEKKFSDCEQKKD